MRAMVIERSKQLFSLKIIKYGIIGVISTLIHMSTALGYIRYISDSLLQSNIAGFLLAYIFSYTMQSYFVFRHDIVWQKALKYFVVQFGSLLTSIAISNLFYYNNYIKTILVIIIMPLITYTIHKFWTFKDEETKG